MAHGLWPRDSSPVQRSSAPGYPPHHIAVRCKAFATKRRWFVRMVSGVLHVSPSARQYGSQLAIFGIEYALDILVNNRVTADKKTPVDLVTAASLVSP